MGVRASWVLDPYIGGREGQMGGLGGLPLGGAVRGFGLFVFCS